MSRIFINGQCYDVPDGASVSVNRNTVVINGDTVADELSGIVKVVWEGVPPVSVTSRAAVEVHGNVQGNVDAGTNVTCHAVCGDVDAGTNVKCGDVGGDVDAGTNVTCGDVRGKVDAGTGVFKR